MNRSTVFLAVTLALSACDGLSGGPRTDGPLLVALDSVRLEETESVYLGQPQDLVTDASGAIYVTDTMNGHVLQFAPDGAFMRRFGGRGNGPGELLEPLTLTVMGDSVLAVADRGRLQFSFYDLRSGDFTRSVPIGGAGFLQSLKASGDTLLLGALDVFRLTSIAAWWPTADSVVQAGTLPREYLETSGLRFNHPYTRLAILGDTVLMGFSGHGPFFLTRRDGAVFDTVSIPAVKRRGVPSDIAARFAAKSLDVEEIVAMVSILQGVQRLPSGEIAAYYTDGVFAENTLSGDGFVSVLSKDLKKACVDAPVATSHVSAPTIAFRGDTLLSLERHITDDAGVHTYLKRYRIDTSRCNWIPVGRKGT